jgi:hypothetical protein
MQTHITAITGSIPLLCLIFQFVNFMLENALNDQLLAVADPNNYECTIAMAAYCFVAAATMQ